MQIFEIQFMISYFLKFYHVNPSVTKMTSFAI